MGKESLALETNEQLATRLFGEAIARGELRTELYLDETNSGCVLERRTLVSGQSGRLLEYEELINTAYADGVEVASGKSFSLSVFSGEESTGENFDLLTHFGFIPGTETLIVSQARHYQIDIENPAEQARLLSYPIYGIMVKEPEEQWQDLLVSLWADNSVPA